MQLGIRNYSIQMTSLTEVFEKVGNFDKNGQDVTNIATQSFSQPLQFQEASVGSVSSRPLNNPSFIKPDLLASSDDTYTGSQLKPRLSIPAMMGMNVDQSINEIKAKTK